MFYPSSVLMPFGCLVFNITTSLPDFQYVAALLVVMSLMSSLS